MVPVDLVYSTDAIGLRAFLPKGVEFFAVHDLDFRPYSLHRGGATHDCLLHANLPKPILRVRWSDLRSGRIYINDGLSMQAQVHLDPSVHARHLNSGTFLQNVLVTLLPPLHGIARLGNVETWVRRAVASLALREFFHRSVQRDSDNLGACVEIWQF